MIMVSPECGHQGSDDVSLFREVDVLRVEAGTGGMKALQL